MTYKRKYLLSITGDDGEAVAFLKSRIPEEWTSLGKARETARCIETVFRGVKARVFGIDRRAGVAPMKKL